VGAAAQKSNQEPPAAPGQHPALARRIARAAGAPLYFRPGTAMVYSNFGFNILGEIVRRVSGQPFWQFAQQRLFEPLCMQDTSYILPAELRSRRVYRGPGMPWVLPIPGLHGGGDSAEYDEIDYGAGGVTSTARDVAIFLQMLLNRGTYDGRRILSPATVAAMTRPQFDSAIRKIFVWADATGKRVEVVSKSGDYGYGLFVQGTGDTYRLNGALGSPTSFGHAGYGGPYIWADPERDLLISFLAVAPRLQREYAAVESDLLQNAVYGAIVA
jgi:CubicO group peptidase (beta-lactamase class C family)